MQQFIPFEKRSKKEKRRISAEKRGTWNGICPVTRRVESKKIYHRKRNPFAKGEAPDANGFYFYRNLTCQMYANCLFHRQHFCMKSPRGNTQCAVS